MPITSCINGPSVDLPDLNIKDNYQFTPQKTDVLNNSSTSTISTGSTACSYNTSSHVKLLRPKWNRKRNKVNNIKNLSEKENKISDNKLRIKIKRGNKNIMSGREYWKCKGIKKSCRVSHFCGYNNNYHGTKVSKLFVNKEPQSKEDPHSENIIQESTYPQSNTFYQRRNDTGVVNVDIEIPQDQSVSLISNNEQTGILDNNAEAVLDSFDLSSIHSPQVSSSNCSDITPLYATVLTQSPEKCAIVRSLDFDDSISPVNHSEGRVIITDIDRIDIRDVGERSTGNERNGFSSYCHSPETMEIEEIPILEEISERGLENKSVSIFTIPSFCMIEEKQLFLPIEELIDEFISSNYFEDLISEFEECPCDDTCCLFIDLNSMRIESAKLYDCVLGYYYEVKQIFLQKLKELNLHLIRSVTFIGLEPLISFRVHSLEQHFMRYISIRIIVKCFYGDDKTTIIGHVLNTRSPSKICNVVSIHRETEMLMSTPNIESLSLDNEIIDHWDNPLFEYSLNENEDENDTLHSVPLIRDVKMNGMNLYPEIVLSLDHWNISHQQFSRGSVLLVHGIVDYDENNNIYFIEVIHLHNSSVPSTPQGSTCLTSLPMISLDNNIQQVDELRDENKKYVKCPLQYIRDIDSLYNFSSKLTIRERLFFLASVAPLRCLLVTDNPFPVGSRVNTEIDISSLLKETGLEVNPSVIPSRLFCVNLDEFEGEDNHTGNALGGHMNTNIGILLDTIKTHHNMRCPTDLFPWCVVPPQNSSDIMNPFSGGEESSFYTNYTVTPFHRSLPLKESFIFSVHNIHDLFRNPELLDFCDIIAFEGSSYHTDIFQGSTGVMKMKMTEKTSRVGVDDFHAVTISSTKKYIPPSDIMGNEMGIGCTGSDLEDAFRLLEDRLLEDTENSFVPGNDNICHYSFNKNNRYKGDINETEVDTQEIPPIVSPPYCNEYTTLSISDSGKKELASSFAHIKEKVNRILGDNTNLEYLIETKEYHNTKNKESVDTKMRKEGRFGEEYPFISTLRFTVYNSVSSILRIAEGFALLTGGMTIEKTHIVEASKFYMETTVRSIIELMKVP